MTGVKRIFTDLCCFAEFGFNSNQCKSIQSVSSVCYDIQLTPASGFHFTVLFLSFVQNSIELLPVISPTPNLLSFHPPKEKGSRGTGTPTFTPIIPALA